MIGAFTCCRGGGVKMLRSVPTPSVVVPAFMLDPFGNSFSGTVGTGNQNCGCGVNWSQRRFLRNFVNSPPPPGGIKQMKVDNALFIIAEIEKHYARRSEESEWITEEISENSPYYIGGLDDIDNSLNLETTEQKYRKSVSGYQHFLSSTLPKTGDKLVAVVHRLIIDGGKLNSRVKSKKEENLLKEWISIQPELIALNRDKMIDYKKQLQVAGEQVLKEMEVNLRKSMNLDDLDQAIEGALCSQAKTEYSQHKSFNDNK